MDQEQQMTPRRSPQALGPMILRRRSGLAIVLHFLGIEPTANTSL